VESLEISLNKLVMADLTPVTTLPTFVMVILGRAGWLVRALVELPLTTELGCVD